MVTFAALTALALAPAPSLSRVVLSNGVTLQVATQGPSSGPAIIMLHGLSDSWFSFSRVLPLFPPDRRIVVPDLRGHGDSDRPVEYRMADFAGDVIRLMDALKIEKAAIVGHSMGSFLRQRAGYSPELVTSEILNSMMTDVPSSIGATRSYCGNFS